jgi:hypothetical protein
MRNEKQRNEKVKAGNRATILPLMPLIHHFILKCLRNSQFANCKLFVV